jgi:hypothetical protein
MRPHRRRLEVFAATPDQTALRQEALVDAPPGPSGVVPARDSVRSASRGYQSIAARLGLTSLQRGKEMATEHTPNIHNQTWNLRAPRIGACVRESLFSLGFCVQTLIAKESNTF